MEHHAPRQRQRIGARGAALDRGADQRHGQGVDDAARGPGVLVHLVEQHRLAVHVEVVGEHGADAEAGELDGPALLHRLVAVHLLDQQHAQHRLAHARRHVRQQAVEVEHQVGAQQRRRQQQAQVDHAAHEYRGAQAERPAAARIAVVAQQEEQHDAPGAAAQDLELVGPDRPQPEAGRGFQGQGAGPERGERAGDRDRRDVAAAAPDRQQETDQQEETDGGDAIAVDGNAGQRAPSMRTCIEKIPVRRPHRCLAPGPPGARPSAPAAEQHDLERIDQDQHVEEQAVVLDVIQVVLQLLQRILG